LHPASAAAGLTQGPVVIAHQARVALGDPIAVAMQAQTVVVALGERPGLSAADSLGVYITHAPRIGTPDSARNCLSNIREGGMDIETAADRAMVLIRAMRQIGRSGVALNQHLAGPALPET
jgi:ethanolamine ammonia-lyase small subunit